MTEFVDQLVNLFILLMTSVITLTVPLFALYLKKKWGLEVDAKAVENVAANALALGAKEVGRRIAAGEIVDDQAKAIALAATPYAAAKLQGEMKRLDMDPASLPERLEARAAASGVSIDKDTGVVSKPVPVTVVQAPTIETKGPTQ